MLLDHIITPRLRLVLMTTESAYASLVNRAKASELLGAEVPEGWPEIHLRNFLPILIERLGKNPSGLPWGPRAIVLAGEGRVIGDIGFHGPPDREGEVEFGYSLLREFWSHGYATEAACALISWTLARPAIRSIRASCDAANLASIRVLEKAGMVCVGGEGSEVRWRLERR